jgi:glutaredoxin 3
MSNMTNGKRSVPQIFIDNVYIGDCEKIYQLEKEKKLNQLIGLD